MRKKIGISKIVSYFFYFIFIEGKGTKIHIFLRDLLQHTSQFLA